MKIDLFLYEHPVFRHEEFVTWKNSQREAPLVRHSVNTALQHYIESGRIMRLRRGLYAAILPTQSADTRFIDSYLIAGRAAEDSILAYHTALELHGLAYSVFYKFTFLTHQKIKPFFLDDRQFQPVANPVALRRYKNEELGVEIFNRQGLDILVTNLERTFVDVLDRPELSGGWEEICRSINSIAVLNISKVIDYCLKFKSARLAAKVGFFLERRKGVFAATDVQLEPLHAAKPKSLEYLSKRKVKDNLLIKKWNLIVPKDILNQSWEEPNVDI